MTKFIDDLKANGYVEGDLSTLPEDISDADRRKVEQWEAEQANQRAKDVQGQEPELHKHHVQLNPNQYGFAETAGRSSTAGADADTKRQSAKTDPLDHDHDGRKGGHIDNRGKADKK